MVRKSNLPSKTLLRLVHEHAVGSDLWVEYKGTLLYRHWSQLYGTEAAEQMWSWWTEAWVKAQPDCNEEVAQLIIDMLPKRE